MAANTLPIFPKTPNVGMAQISTANTNRDGTTGSYTTVFTAGANGSRIESAIIKATVTTTAGMIRVFLNDGVNRYLYDEIPVNAVTPSGTVVAFQATILSLFGLTLKSGWTVDFSTNNAETFTIAVAGGDY